MSVESKPMEGNVVYEGMGAPPKEGFVQRQVDKLKARWNVDNRVALKIKTIEQDMGQRFTDEQRQQVADRIRGEMQKQVVGNYVKDAVAATVMTAAAVYVWKNPAMRARVATSMADWSRTGGESFAAKLGKKAEEYRAGNPGFFKRSIASILETGQKATAAASRKGQEVFAGGAKGAFSQMAKESARLRGAKEVAEKAVETARAEGKLSPEAIQRLEETAKKAAERQSTYSGKVVEAAKSVRGKLRPVAQNVNAARKEKFVSGLLR